MRNAEILVLWFLRLLYSLYFCGFTRESARVNFRLKERKARRGKRSVHTVQLYRLSKTVRLISSQFLPMRVISNWMDITSEYWWQKIFPRTYITT